MDRLVPDASVILKWVLPAHRETHVEHALALLDAFAREEIELIVPRLWLYEVGNTVTRKNPDGAGEIMRDLLALEMEEAAHDDTFVRETVRLAARYSVTFYDAAYHAVAIARQATLISADERYLRAAAAESHAVALARWL